MRPTGPRAGHWTRRSWLALAAPAGALLQAQSDSYKGRALATDWGKYPDRATEFEVVRLTGAAYASFLPSLPARAANRRSSEILMACSRTGSMQVHRLEISNGRSRVLTAARDLDPASVTWSGDDRQAFYVDEGRLMSVQLSNQRESVLHEPPQNTKVTGPLGPTDDGTGLFFIEQSARQSSLKWVRLPKGDSATVADSPTPLLHPAPNPRRATVCWRTETAELWVSAFDGSGRRRIETPPGKVLESFWNPDGQKLLYLLEPDDPTQLVQVREQELDARTDRLVAKTSQFARFAPNANASVFVGASRSKASPAVLLLLRITRRELTLCEHRAASPSTAAVCFTPNSQRILFESDQHGQPAIYTMNVERLVEKTES